VNPPAGSANGEKVRNVPAGPSRRRRHWLWPVAGGVPLGTVLALQRVEQAGDVAQLDQKNTTRAVEELRRKPQETGRQQRTAAERASEQAQNGRWNIEWVLADVIHRGDLEMRGGTGLMRIEVRQATGAFRYVVDQTINMVIDGAGQPVFLIGSAPRDAATQQPVSHYTPDILKLKIDSARSVNIMGLCDANHVCAPVRAERAGFKN
jgi:hypothetical protein